MPARPAVTPRSRAAPGGHHRPEPIGRMPVLDVRPAVDGGRRPAKAVEGEPFEVSTTIFRAGREAVGATVVLPGPGGRRGPWTPMRELAPGTDRWGADVTPTVPGRWTYTVEAWSDPVTTWQRTAAVKMPSGIDVELTLAEGAELLARAAAGVPKGRGRGVLHGAAAGLRDQERPALERLLLARRPRIGAVLERYRCANCSTAPRSSSWW